MSAALVAALSECPGPENEAALSAAVAAVEAASDDDVQLSLYACYGVHYCLAVSSGGCTS
ncbi:MAG: hypothetical protein U0Q15_00715 [Kineosporiaceae bacterium]